MVLGRVDYMIRGKGNGAKGGCTDVPGVHTGIRCVCDRNRPRHQRLYFLAAGRSGGVLADTWDGLVLLHNESAGDTFNDDFDDDDVRACVRASVRACVRACVRE